MIDTYVNEFIKLYEFFQDKSYAIIKVGCVAVPKDKLEELLAKYLFDEPRAKLKIWKQLGWIDCDDRRYTRRFRVDGKYIEMVCMQAAVYGCLSQIQGKKSVHISKKTVQAI